MKGNLIKGIVFISAVALSSCSAPNKLAGVKNTINNDDVYYTKAMAGDKIDYLADAGDQQNTNYNGDDDYYYYGDYASRLSRFSNYSPFDYNDDFYFSYVPYNNGFGLGSDANVDYYGNNYGYGLGHAANLTDPFYDEYVYSPYDYGYSPYYYGGYDDFGYGDIYSSYISGGGGSWHRHNHIADNHNHIAGNNTGTNPAARGIRTTPSPGVTRISPRTAYYPGNPTVNLNRVNGFSNGGVRNGGVRNGANVNGVNNSATRQTRESFRQQPITPPPSYNNSSSGNSSSGSGASSGGGGRPVRP